MRRRVYPREQMQLLSNKLRELKLHVKSLEAQRRRLSVQHSVLVCCCDILHSLRSGVMHKEWMQHQDTWLPDELRLLQDLGAEFGDWAPSCSHCSKQQQSVVALMQQQQQQQQQQRQQPLQHHTALEAEVGELSTCCPLSSQLRPGSAGDLHSPQTWQAARCHSDSCSHGRCASMNCCAGTTPCRGAPAASEHAPAIAAATPAGHFKLSHSWIASRPGDYLGPLREALLLPPYPGAATLTLQQLASYYTSLIKELALHLSLLEQQQERGDDVCSGSDHPLLVLHQRVAQHTRLITAILLLHPDDLLHKFRVLNLNTLELSDTAEQAWEHMSWLLDKLHLTEQQQEVLVDGSELFKRLVDSIRAERQQLVAQQARQADERLATGRAVDLAAQEESADRLQLLLRKERFLLTCASVFVSSVLDVVQVVRCSVLTFPWTPHLGMIAAVLAAKQAAKQPQQQQQQRQEEEEEEGTVTTASEQESD